jgi:hypothetical protein
MCPVKLWASIISRILSFKGTTQNSPVSLAQHNNKTISITSEMVTNLLKDESLKLDAAIVARHIVDDVIGGR